MNMVNGKCPNCGASITLDKDKDAGICEYCGTAFVTEKAVINYGTYINKQENNTYHKKQDNEYSVELKKLEMEKEKRNDKFCDDEFTNLRNTIWCSCKKNYCLCKRYSCFGKSESCSTVAE